MLQDEPGKVRNLIEIQESSIDDPRAVVLTSELDDYLRGVTGGTGAKLFKKEDLSKERTVFLLAFYQGEVCGCGAIRQLTPEIAEVKRVYTKVKRKGVGSAIIHALEDKAWQFGYQMIRIETGEENKGAIRFYHRMGFSPCEVYEPYLKVNNARCFEKKRPVLME